MFSTNTYTTLQLDALDIRTLIHTLNLDRQMLLALRIKIQNDENASDDEIAAVNINIQHNHQLRIKLSQAVLFEKAG